MITNPKNFFEQLKNLCEEQALQLKAVLNKFSSYLTGSEIEETYLKKTDASLQYLGKTAKASSASTADSATKATQDSSGNNIVNTYATKNSVTESLTSKADKVHTHSVGDVSNLSTSLNAKLDVTTYNSDKASFLTTENVYTKSEVDAKVSAVYRFKSSVASEANLPKSGNTIGDVYNVNDTGANYAWNGSAWDKLSETIDLTPYLKSTDAANTYLKSSDASSTYLKTSDAANTYLGKTAKAESAKTADTATSATKATQDASGNVITETYATKSELNNKTPTSHASTSTTYGAGSGSNYGHVKLSDAVDSTSGPNAGIAATPAAVKFAYDLANQAKNVVHVGSDTPTSTAATLWVDTDGDTIAPVMTINGKSPDESGNINIDVPEVDTSSLITKNGNRGNLSGYEIPNITANAITINQNSPDSTQVTGAVSVTVATGTEGTSWTKTVSLVSAWATVTLSDAWVWSGGEVPTVSENAVLVLHWCNDVGVANLLEGAAFTRTFTGVIKNTGTAGTLADGTYYTTIFVYREGTEIYQIAPGETKECALAVGDGLTSNMVGLSVQSATGITLQDAHTVTSVQDGFEAEIYAYVPF